MSFGVLARVVAAIVALSCAGDAAAHTAVDAPGSSGQVSGRQTPGNSITEAFVYDVQGRLTEWDTADSPAGDALQRSLQYDGLGRLSRFHTVDPSLSETYADYVYGADNELLLEERYGSGSAFPGDAIYRFRGHRYDSGKDETLDEVLPMLRVRDGSEFLLVQRDNGDAALAVYDAAGGEETFEVTGVYGGQLNATGLGLIGLVGPAFPVDGLHGGDIDRERGVVHRGRRHAMLDDGRWLQPEPLLAAALFGAPLNKPGAFGPGYGAGNPVSQEDRSGYIVQEVVLTALDVKDTVQSAVAWTGAMATFVAAPSIGSYLGACQAGAVVSANAGATLAGAVLPGGGLTQIDNVYDAVKGGGAAADVAKAGDKASDASQGAPSLHTQAEAARDALSGSLAGGKHPPATVVGAYSPASGKVTAGASRGGGLGCAEGVCAEALDNAADIQFTTAVRPRTGKTVPVCENCETTFGRDAFPDPDTPFKTDQ